MPYTTWPPRHKLAGPDFDCCEGEASRGMACPYSMGRYACWEACGCKEGPRRPSPEWLEKLRGD